MKTHTLRTLFATLVAMLCALFALPQQAQAQEAYVQLSADKTTLTFYYDTQRNARQGQTWGIEEKRNDYSAFPAWAGTNNNPNTTTTKAVVDASFKDFRPTSTAKWFHSSKALTAIEGLQYLNTSNVTDMRSMFFACSSLTSLYLKSFNTENVTNMRGMFSGCSALTTLDLSDFNTSKVTDMGWMFSGCSALTSLDLKNFNTSNVKDMAVMFQGCSGLTSLDLMSFNPERVEYMRYMFYNCSALTAIYCPNTWQCKESQDMFKGCTQLQGAVKFDASKLDGTMANPTNGYFTKTKPTAIEQMFLNAHKAKGIYTLQGKRVTGDFQHLPAGVYIVNGVLEIRR